MSRILFTNVKLYDGSGKAPFLADVAVEGDKIAEVAQCGKLGKTGAEVVDGQGKDLVPGFVDVHTHSESTYARIPSADSRISQGVTTDISGNCGSSYYLTGAKKASDGYRDCYGSFAAFADSIEKSKIAVNAVHLCGHNALRIHVMGYEDREPTKEEMRKMKELLAEALKNGAGGMSSGLWYLPGKFAKTEEVCELASLLKGTGKPYATHIRSEGEFLLESIEEAIRIARAGDGNLEISHLKTGGGQKNWHKIDGAFSLIENARAEGLNVNADRYPYTYSGTSLRMIVPAPYNTIDTATLCTHLKESPEYRKELAHALAEKASTPFARVIVVSSPFAEHKKFYGKNLEEIAADMNCTAAEATAALLAAGDSPSAAYGTMCEENLEKILAKPYIVCGSDSSFRAFGDGSTHPRAFGTCPRFFRIATKHCSYESVIHRMTALPAKKFKLEKRGLIVPGYFADLVLLDLDKFECDADYGHPCRVAAGVEKVYVNGALSYAPDPEIPRERKGRMLRIR
ncbi:MAG: amidohydrolase family protein [Lentisphaeria bacterium]|nr:amidohydrolase family protein [Lentisphaeria bacterium]